MFDLTLLLQHIQNQPKRVEEQITTQVRPIQSGRRQRVGQLQSDGRTRITPGVNIGNPFRFGDPRRKPEIRPETPSPENNFDFPSRHPGFSTDPGFHPKMPEPKPDPRFPGMPPGFRPPIDPGFHPKMPEPKPRFPGMPDGLELYPRRPDPNNPLRPAYR